MRILAASLRDWKHSDAGGGEQLMKEFLTHLKDRGHDITLVSAAGEGLPGEEILDGIEVRRVGHRYLWKLNSFIIDREVGRISGDYDILFYSANNIFPVLSVNIPQVNIIHEYHGWNFLDLWSFPLNLVGVVSEQLTYRLLEGKNIFNSPSTKKMVEERTSLTGNILTLGIDVDDFKYAEGERNRVLYLGRLERRKGIEMLPEIKEELDERMEEYHLDIAGDGSFRAIAEELDEDEKVDYHGYVSEDKKKELLAQASVMVVPSKKEGWGIVVYEANASGTPVIASDAEGLKDSVDDGVNGVLVEREPKKFAQAVVQVLGKDMSRQCFNHVKDETWESKAEELEEIFRKAT